MSLKISRGADLDCAKEFLVMKTFVVIAVLLFLGKPALFAVDSDPLTLF